MNEQLLVREGRAPPLRGGNFSFAFQRFFTKKQAAEIRGFDRLIFKQKFKHSKV